MKQRVHPVTFEFPFYGIYVFNSRHGRGFSMPLHSSAHHELVLVRHGSGKLVGPTGMLTLQPEHLIHIAPETDHRFIDSPHNPMTLTNLCFREEIFRDDTFAQQVYRHFVEEFPTLTPVPLSNMYRREYVRGVLQNMIQEQTFQKDGYPSMLWSLLVQMLVFLNRMCEERSLPETETSHANAVAACLDYLEANFVQQIAVSELAKLTDYSERRLSTLFREATGKTMHQYLTGLRISYAKKRLLESGNITHAAFESGFNDLSNFYRVFKKETGRTPRFFLRCSDSDQ